MIKVSSIVIDFSYNVKYCNNVTTFRNVLHIHNFLHDDIFK